VQLLAHQLLILLLVLVRQLLSTQVLELLLLARAALPKFLSLVAVETQAAVLVVEAVVALVVITTILQHIFHLEP
jgi:hypothetical protein